MLETKKSRLSQTQRNCLINIPFPNPVFLDTEFQATSSRWYPNLYMAVAMFQGKQHIFNFLTDHTAAHIKMCAFLRSIPRPNTLIAYGIDAETRFLNTLYHNNRISPILFDNFICLFREFRLLCNRNREMVFGEVVSNKAKIKRKFVANKKSENTEDQKYTGLLNAQWKMLKVFDERHARAKAVITKLCASGETKELKRIQDEVQRYCEDDVRHLPALTEKIYNYLTTKLKTPHNTLLQQMLFRGRYGELISYKTQRGYYVDTAKIMNLINNTPNVLRDIAEHILKSWPEFQTFTWDIKLNRYVFHREEVARYIYKKAPSLIPSFGASKVTGKLSLSTEYFEKLFPQKHALKQDSYLEQVYKYLYTMNSLKGLSLYKQKDPEKSKKFGNYFDIKEHLVRPYFNDFGSQTGRNQPAANGYLLLKPAWIRKVLVPPPKHCLMIADISREEVLILAILSGDEKMLEDFAKGDIYEAFGLRTGALTEAMRGTNEWKVTRSVIKQVVLSILYGKGPKALAQTLSNETGKLFTMPQAKNLINSFWATYSKAKLFADRYILNYQRNKYAMLGSGWVMWGNNYNERSVGNFPMQGTGADVMRAVDMMLDAQGMWSPFTLHDAFAIYSPLIGPSLTPNPADITRLVDCVRQGFKYALQGKKGCELVSNDLKLICPNMIEETFAFNYRGEKLKIEIMPEYIDERAIEDLKLYDKYFEPFKGERK